MNWADEPIAREADDLLGRSQYVNRIAQLIRSTGAASTVFAVTGPWGGGKTSVLNLVSTNLAQSDQTWQVRRFAPWAASDVGALVAELFATLSAAVPKTKGDTARKAVRACGQVAVPLLSQVPTAGGALAAGARIGLSKLDENTDWESRFAKASGELVKLDLRVLIVVDDVDRLQSDELASLLKAVRLLGRFPGVHYLLAFDPVTVRRVLTHTDVVGVSDDRAADAFLEKIVQVSLPLPPIQPAQLEATFNSETSRLLAEFDVALDEGDARRLGFAYQRLLSQTLTTLRSVHRFFWQVRAYLPLVDPAEINIVDFMLLTHLNQHFPAIYEQIWQRRDEVTDSLIRRFLAATTPGLEAPDGAWPRLLEETQVATHLREPLLEVLGSLFPAMPGVASQGIPPSASTGGRRICDPVYLPRYFALTLPADDVSDARVNEALTRLEAGDLVGWTDFKSEYLSASATDAVERAVIDKLRSLSQSRDDLDHARLCVGAASMLKDLPKQWEEPFEQSTHDRVVDWVASEIASCSHPVDAESLLAHLKEALGDDLVPLIRALNDAITTHDEAKLLRHRLWQSLALELRKRIVDNLALRNDAPDEPVLNYIDFCLRGGETSALAVDIAEVQTRLQIPISEVAARFINDSWNAGQQRWQLGQLEQGLLEQVIPIDQLRDHPDYPLIDLDLDTLDWPNRVAAAELALNRAYPRDLRSQRADQGE